MSKQACKRMRRHLKLEVSRDPLPSFAWPGGYPLIYVMIDGGVLCPDCINTEITQIDSDTRDYRTNKWGGSTGWEVAAVDVHWEGNSIICDHCGCEIESAYGPIEQE